MLNRIKEVIVDFQGIQLNTGVARDMSSIPITGKAGIFIGVRRCGKSTYLFQVIDQLVSKGISRQNILYLNFFDDRLYGLERENLGLILEAYFSLYPEKRGTETIYFFFDEIQSTSGWEPFIDRLLRTIDCEVYITGSSARMLSKEIATQMRGRAISWEMFPFSFKEFLDAKNVDSNGPISTRKRLLIQKLFDDFWESGGFPEVISSERLVRIKTHQEYFNAMLFCDLVERHDISHPRALMDLAHWLINNTASLYSINNLTGYLKSLGHKVPKTSVSDYLAWFEDAYILFTVRIFDSSISRANANPKKIYCIDHSMVTSVSSRILVNSGHLLENLVFTALRRITSEIFYYRCKSGREVDFIAKPHKKPRMLVQVCESLSDPKTRKRELTSLSEAMNEQKLDSGIVVSRGEEEVLRLEYGVIEVMPAWRFLLKMTDLESD